MDNKTKRQSESTLSIIALIFLILDTFSGMLFSLFNILPFGLVSLVLAIISYAKYKDTLSIVVIGVNVIKIVLLLLLFVFFWKYIINVFPEMPSYGGVKI